MREGVGFQGCNTEKDAVGQGHLKMYKHIKQFKMYPKIIQAALGVNIKEFVLMLICAS